MPTKPPTHRHPGWQPRKAWASTTKTSTERGYGTAWRRLRQIVIRRDQGLCQECQRQGRVTAGNEVDHVTSKARGGTDALDNLQLLCNPCHKAKTARERNE
ncbi:MAG: HNH endonuclease [Ketobacter sp.]|nr:HNH endonuclease [Ketobacter sp.]